MEAARYCNYSGDVWLLRQISYLAADFHAARETTDFSGLIRNGDGRMLVCFSVFAGYSTNLLPELLSLKHGFAGCME